MLVDRIRSFLSSGQVHPRRLGPARADPGGHDVLHGGRESGGCRPEALRRDQLQRMCRKDV
jgi:hypothetical protein